ncbi:hypothetical protein Bca101_090493 [Brassica carinata]
MDSFEKQFVNMEVQAEFMENAMAGSTSLSTPEGDVNHLMQQIGSQLRDGNSFLKAKRISTWSGLGGTGKLVTLTHPKKQVVKMYTAK